LKLTNGHFHPDFYAGEKNKVLYFCTTIITLGIGLECRRKKCCQVYKAVTDGDELFTKQPNFGAKMVKDKTTPDHNYSRWHNIIHRDT